MSGGLGTTRVGGLAARLAGQRYLGIGIGRRARGRVAPRARRPPWAARLDGCPGGG